MGSAAEAAGVSTAEAASASISVAESAGVSAAEAASASMHLRGRSRDLATHYRNLPRSGNLRGRSLRSDALSFRLAETMLPARSGGMMFSRCPRNNACVARVQVASADTEYGDYDDESG